MRISSPFSAKPPRNQSRFRQLSSTFPHSGRAWGLSSLRVALDIDGNDWPMLESTIWLVRDKFSHSPIRRVSGLIIIDSDLLYLTTSSYLRASDQPGLFITQAQMISNSLEELHRRFHAYQIERKTLRVTVQSTRVGPSPILLQICVIPLQCGLKLCAQVHISPC